MMRNKKGDLAIGPVIAIILGLVVLIILIMVVRQQVTKGAERYDAIGGEAELAADKCASIIFGRACSSNCDPNKKQKQVYSPAGQWKDCSKVGKVCCESI